ncbi:MAG: Coenzyme F420 hydrogenase/dehydrogenase, beta subunit C-terminal domain [Euryarchaeota archaeon]|nr:Coenzyme F420 hydrogenase/dehydrogenase, beta subunit C-terminal domain [Euryarchaeota archaeon]
MAIPKKGLPILLILILLPAAHAHVSQEGRVDMAMGEIGANLGKMSPADLQGIPDHAKEIETHLEVIKGELDLGADYNRELAGSVADFEAHLLKLEEAAAEGDGAKALAASRDLERAHARIKMELQRPKVDRDRLALALGGLLGTWLLLAALMFVASNRLQARVLKERTVEVFPGEGLCGACGACEVACPDGAIEVNHQGPRYLGGADCAACEGSCIAVCPVQFPGEWGDGLGPFRRMVAVRSRLPEVLARAQDGGLATTLAIHLLDSQRAEGVLMVRRRGLSPEPFIARTREEALSAAGSTYALSPSLPTLEGVEGRIAMVGLPCQVTGAEKLGAMEKLGNITFKAGLFCRANFLPGGMEALASRAGLSQKGVRRVDISGGRVHLDGRAEFPLRALADYENPGCKVCADPLARMADISIGGVGVPKGWSLAVVRTLEGEAVLDEMIGKGLIKAAPVDDKTRRDLERFARAKTAVKP